MHTTRIAKQTSQRRGVATVAGLQVVREFNTHAVVVKCEQTDRPTEKGKVLNHL